MCFTLLCHRKYNEVDIHRKYNEEKYPGRNVKGIISQLVGRYGRLARFYLKINAFVLTTQVLYTTSYLFRMSH